MSHEHIEHAEHATHHAHDPFDRHVALTIAIVAAILAAVTVLAHRAHTDTLGFKTDAADKWALYQAQKIRMHQYEALLEHLEFEPIRPGAEKKAEKAIAKWSSQVTAYGKKLKNWKAEAEELEHKSHLEHERARRFDLGELFVEVAVVLCSVAILTKRRSFWYVGMISCIVGAVIALTGFFGFWMPESHSTEEHPPASQSSTQH
jgi:hypothetical protein